MSVLHKEFVEYDSKIKLSDKRKKRLKKSRKKLRKNSIKWFRENKPNELPPKFASQGSIEMNTAVNPIPRYDEDGNKLLHYDLDDGIYFIERLGEDNKRAIDTWHDWVFDSVDNHTGEDSIRKTTCVRVVFADGHHIDLPIYYKKNGRIVLAHRSKGWIESDPKEFHEWFNKLKNDQLERFVRYFKGWKDFKEFNNSSLKLPSGFELTILALNNYVERDNDDEAFRESVRRMLNELNRPNGFKCLRPTTPKNEDVFADYSETRKSNFLSALTNLLSDLDSAASEKNFKIASETLRINVFGDRFPRGEDKDQAAKSDHLGRAISTAAIKPRPYGF